MSEITHDGTVYTIKPGMDIVASMVPDFKTELKDTINEGASRLIIDLSGVEMLDSMGIGVLIAAHNSLKKMSGTLEVIQPSKDILNLLKNMRLDKHFKIVQDE